MATTCESTTSQASLTLREVPSIMPTFATETRSSRLPVQELVDAILDYLHDSRQDLTACALVSHSFVHRTQSHLFRSIALDVDEEHCAGMSMPLVEKAQRLADILATSPTSLHTFIS
ncbi:hypothetical protein C8R44DRAFT_880958 [Mycena epipterygia]|nr:hypothetical protein C8R44DRAFT_880958 [Mycena epipterygia]